MPDFADLPAEDVVVAGRLILKRKMTKVLSIFFTTDFTERIGGVLLTS
jgi:hypothetical protein